MIVLIAERIKQIEHPTGTFFVPRLEVMNANKVHLAVHEYPDGFNSVTGAIIWLDNLKRKVHEKYSEACEFYVLTPMDIKKLS